MTATTVSSDQHPALSGHPYGDLPDELSRPPEAVHSGALDRATDSADEDVWDYSLPDKPKRFKVNGDEVYEAPALLGVPALRALAKMNKGMSELDADAKFERVLGMFDIMLTKESGPRFRERIEDADNPVDLQRQLMPILNRLMEAYGLRPTEAAGSSSDGSSSTGDSSTDGVYPEESTLSDSALTGS